MATVIPIRDLEALEGLRLVWDALLLETDRATFFQTFDWCRFVLADERFGLSPQILVVESGDKPIGILPLMLNTRRTRWGEFRVLGPPPAVRGSLFRPIGRNVTATLLSSARFLKKHAGEWDQLDLPGIERAGPDGGRTEDAFMHAGFRLSSQADHPLKRIDFAAAGKGAANGAVRSDAGPSDEAAGSWLHLRPLPQRMGDGDPQWDQFDRWIGDRPWPELKFDLTGVRTRPSAIELLTEIHAVASRAGVADLLIAIDDERPLGFVYHLRHERSWVRLAVGVAEGISKDGLEERMTDEAIRRWQGDLAGRLEFSDHSAMTPSSASSLISRRRYQCLANPSPRVQMLRMLNWLTAEQAS